jgi:hypothetical protein
MSRSESRNYIAQGSRSIEIPFSLATYEPTHPPATKQQPNLRVNDTPSLAFSFFVQIKFTANAEIMDMYALAPYTLEYIFNY